MPFVILTPLLVIAAVLALALDVPARRVLTWTAAGIVGLVVLTVVSALGVFVIEGGDGEVATPGRWAPIPVRDVDADLIPAAVEPFPEPERPIDGLADGDTVLLRVAGRVPLTVHQCPADQVRPRACSRGIPATAERTEDPVVLVELHVTVAATAGKVDCRSRPCVVAAFGPDGRPQASRPIVFGDSPPSPRLRGPVGPIDPGDTVTVRLDNLVPGTTGAVTLCIPGEEGEPPVCGRPAPEVPFRAGADGAASVDLPVVPGLVGREGRRCEPRAPCAIGVVGTPTPTPFWPVRFAPPVGAEVPVRREGPALAIAGVLVAVAAVIVRRTDWSPPGGDPFADVALGGDPFVGVDLDDNPGW